ncbi:MAG: hypothetical protein M1374_01295 [Firmicutes bacterium]|jgi:hypothetical protein|nr:hypothetical protein [Bacillota bacterium]
MKDASSINSDTQEGQKISIADIQQKIRDNIGGKNIVSEKVSSQQLIIVKAVVVVLMVLVSYVMGRFQGKSDSTILEVKRV